MLTADQISVLRDKSSQLLDPIIDFLIENIAKRVKQAGQFTGTASYEIWKLQELGVSQRQIKREIAKRLKKSQEEAEKLLTQAAETGYNFDMSRFPTSHAVPLAANSNLQQILDATLKQEGEDLTNITRTTGFVGPDGVCRELTDAYTNACDFAFQKVSTGAQDYTSAIRDATRNLAQKGIRTIDYKSGRHYSIEAAVRQNIMGGLGLMQEQISESNHDLLECDGWEISAHAASAPDHEPIQGKQYTDEEYQKLNNRLVRRIGTLNCGHAAFPIIMGVNAPQYTEEELEQLRRENADGVEFEGRHYTLYEATQRQRKFERAIRNQKRKILIDEALEDADKLQTDQICLVRLRQEYARFSEGVGLPQQHARMETAGFNWKKGKAAEKAAKHTNNDKIAEHNNGVGKTVDGKGSVGRVESNWDPTIGTQSWSKSAKKAMQIAEHNRVSEHYEIAQLYDEKGDALFKKEGTTRAVNFTENEIKQMSGGVLTHNHPNGSCFSPQDINMLRRGKLAEIRAVTQQGIYQLQKPAKWKRDISSLEKIVSMYYDIDKSVSPAIYAKAAHGDITYAQAEAQCQEIVIREFARKFGLGYRFETWDDLKGEGK